MPSKLLSKKHLFVFLFAGFTLFLTEISYTVYFGLKSIDIGFVPEYIIVFGNKVNTNGTLSERLKARLTETTAQNNKYPNAQIIVSGGLGKEGFYEGNKMASYLIKNGIDSALIHIDNNGVNSLATLQNSQKLTQNHRVLFISQFYHLRRIELLATKLNYQHFKSSSPNYFEFRDFYSLFREFFAIYKYKITL
ncbi:MAG: YdcF family protein [Bacteroidia bacterium]